jgi:hypothetical protein
MHPSLSTPPHAPGSELRPTLTLTLCTSSISPPTCLPLETLHLPRGCRHAWDSRRPPPSQQRPVPRLGLQPRTPCPTYTAPLPAHTFSNDLDQATAAALGGLSCLEHLGLGWLLPVNVELSRAYAPVCAAVVAALPPSVRTLELWSVGACMEGAALVVPPGRALVVGQTHLLRDDTWGFDPEPFHARTGGATADDVRTFLGWLSPHMPLHVRLGG